MRFTETQLKRFKTKMTSLPRTEENLNTKDE